MRTKRSESDALRLLGLARRAGAVEAGVRRTRQALRGGHARLVLVAGDASEVQTKKFEKLMEAESVPGLMVGDRATLGAAVGAAPLSAVAITDRGFAERLLHRLS